MGLVGIATNVNKLLPVAKYTPNTMRGGSELTQDAAVKGKSETEVQALIDEDIEKINNDMPKYKRIKQVYLRTEPFEKTTTQKIKRRTVK